MFFTVIIPTYNRSKRLIQCLDALLPNLDLRFQYEILIVDDGSTDDTEERVQWMQKKYTNIGYIKTDNWGGPARPRNIGIKHAKGDYIVFIDSDDIPFPFKLTRIYDLLISTKSEVLYHRLTRTDNGRKIGYKFKDLRTIVNKGNVVPLSALVVRRDCLTNLAFSESRECIAVEDFDLIIQLLKKGYIFNFYNKSLGYYSVNDSNISADKLKMVSKEEKLLTRHCLMSPKAFRRLEYSKLVYSDDLQKKQNEIFRFITYRLDIFSIKLLWRVLFS